MLETNILYLFFNSGYLFILGLFFYSVFLLKLLKLFFGYLILRSLDLQNLKLNYPFRFDKKKNDINNKLVQLLWLLVYKIAAYSEYQILE